MFSILPALIMWLLTEKKKGIPTATLAAYQATPSNGLPKGLKPAVSFTSDYVLSPDGKDIQSYALTPAAAATTMPGQPGATRAEIIRRYESQAAAGGTIPWGWSSWDAYLTWLKAQPS